MRDTFKVAGFVALAGALGITGCVSTGKYTKLQADKDDLNSKYHAAAAKSAALEKSVADLQNENATLKDQNTALEDAKSNLAKSGEETKSQYESVLGKLQQEVQEGNLKVTQYKNMLTVDVAEQLFFDSGRASLKAGGKTVLAKVGEALKQYQDKVIRVVGHTDNVPLAKNYQRIFPTNWDLSVARATNVVRFLQEQGGIPGDRLIAAGRGEFDPVAPNDTAEGRRKNRRIEITLIDKSAMTAERKGAAAPSPEATPEATPATDAPAQ